MLGYLEMRVPEMEA